MSEKIMIDKKYIVNLLKGAGWDIDLLCEFYPGCEFQFKKLQNNGDLEISNEGIDCTLWALGFLEDQPVFLEQIYISDSKNWKDLISNINNYTLHSMGIPIFLIDKLQYKNIFVTEGFIRKFLQKIRLLENIHAYPNTTNLFHLIKNPEFSYCYYNVGDFDYLLSGGLFNNMSDSVKQIISNKTMIPRNVIDNLRDNSIFVTKETIDIISQVLERFEIKPDNGFGHPMHEIPKTNNKDIIKNILKEINNLSIEDIETIEAYCNSKINYYQ